MSQVTLYLDDAAKRVLDEGAAREKKSKSRFLADLLVRWSEEKKAEAYRAKLDAVMGTLSDLPDEEMIDFAAIRAESNANSYSRPVFGFDDDDVQAKRAA
jgi:hypothetical protein